MKQIRRYAEGRAGLALLAAAFLLLTGLYNVSQPIWELPKSLITTLSFATWRRTSPCQSRPRTSPAGRVARTRRTRRHSTMR